MADEKPKDELGLITVGSLFSGIGGIELGLERTGGFKTIWNCEIDAYASAVLKKHWPEVPNLGDITKVNWDGVEKPDMLCGGFPCQDISIAGKKKGIQENTRSGLWWEYAKGIRILQPKFVFIENVSELINNGLDVVLSDLASLRYDAEWQVVPASSVGAPHKRDRLFVVAYPHDNGHDRGQVLKGQLQADFKWDMEAVVKERLRCQFATVQDNQDVLPEILPAEGTWSAVPLFCRVANGVPSRVDRIKCLGNAVVPQVAQVIGEMILEASRGEQGDDSEPPDRGDIDGRD